MRSAARASSWVFTGFSGPNSTLMAPFDDAENTEGAGEDAGRRYAGTAPRADLSRGRSLADWEPSVAVRRQHRCVRGACHEMERGAVFTSPPYGNQRDYTTGGVGDWDALMRGVFASLPVTDSRLKFWSTRNRAPRERVAALLASSGLTGCASKLASRGFFTFRLRARIAGRLERTAGAELSSSSFTSIARRASRTKSCPASGPATVNDTHGGIRHKDGHVGEWTYAGQGAQDIPF